MKNIYLILFLPCLIHTPIIAQVWTFQNVGIPTNLQMLDISAPDSKTVWVSGFAGDFYAQPWNYVNGNTTLARSTDGGLTWQQSTINAGAGGSITCLYAIDSLTAWATCINNFYGGKVFKTTNGGGSWAQQTTAAFSNFGYADWIYFWNANEGVCLGDPINNVFEVFRTTNGGNNWTRVSALALTNEIAFNEMYQVSGDTIWFGTSAGRIIRSTNRGQEWQYFSSRHATVDAMAFSKGHGLGISFGNAFLGSYSNKMTLTTNGGETWSTPTAPSFGNQAVFDAAFVPESDYIVVTARSHNGNGPFNTYLSRNKGATWTQIDDQAPITKLKFVSPLVGYGGGHKKNGITPSRLYRYTGSPLTGLLTPSVLEANISLSPNPIADQLNIQLTYKEASDFRLNINNLLGELVYFEDFKDVSSINKSLNIKQFPSGTYILTVANPTGNVSRKFVKME